MGQEKEKKERIRSSSWLWTASLMVGAAALVAYRQVGSWDFFWHLQVGKVAVAEGTTLPVDIFSFSAEGDPWIYKDLIADVFLWGAFAALGYLGIALIKAFAVVIAAAGFRLCKVAAQAPMSAWVAAVLYIAAIQNRLVERPLLFSLALFPLLLGCVERLSANLTETDWKLLARRCIPVVIVQWIWACLHRAAVTGIALLVAFALYAVIRWAV